VTETQLQILVAELCAELGLHHYHARDSRLDDLAVPGFPDSVIIGTEILFRELKSQDGILKPEQRRWGSRIQRAGGDWAVWRPADWQDRTILRKLVSIRPTRLS
jgi:hypothetical protein